MRLRNGQAIIEVMIAVSVGVVALLALVQLANKTVVNNGIAKRVTEAHDLATQAMELVRSAKAVNGWRLFKSTYASGSWCFNGNVITNGSNCAIGTSEYKSDVSFVFSTNVNSEQAVVTVTVNWIEGSQTKTAVVDTVLSKY